MNQKVEYLTAESEQGRLAIEEVMRYSYKSDIDNVPPRWAIARIVDGVPVSFILVKPDGKIEFPRGEICYVFVDDVATREDRRLEGHFRGIMEYMFSKVRSVEIPLIQLHGEQKLYRRLGFDVCTHHYGIFATPELIERKLGTQIPEGARELLKISDSQYLQKDLLMVDYVKAETLPECKSALQAAAAIARERGKARILFWGPDSLIFGSAYPAESCLTVMARACGAQICIRGGEPEGPEDHADWIRVLDTALLVKEALKCLPEPEYPLPKGEICFDTDAGAVTIESSGSSVTTSDGVKPGVVTVNWQSSAIAQLVTGYHTAGVLSAIHDTPLPAEIKELLEALFPQQWRFTANENWFF
jgi:hypothetical protein